MRSLVIAFGLALCVATGVVLSSKSYAQVLNLTKDASGTVGTSYKAVLPQGVKEYLLIENESASNYIAVTIDSTVPVINGQGSITLAPYQIYSPFPEWIPAGGINVVGSGSGSVYTVKYR